MRPEPLWVEGRLPFMLHRNMGSGPLLFEEPPSYRAACWQQEAPKGCDRARARPACGCLRGQWRKEGVMSDWLACGRVHDPRCPTPVRVSAGRNTRCLAPLVSVREQCPYFQESRVIPVKAGVQASGDIVRLAWIPAFAGVTRESGTN